MSIAELRYCATPARSETHVAYDDNDKTRRFIITDFAIEDDNDEFKHLTSDLPAVDEDEDDELDESDPFNSSHSRGDILGMSGMGMV